VGKGLSTEDYTTAENKISGLSNNGGNVDLSVAKQLQVLI
jgi:hypothetical protein